MTGRATSSAQRRRTLTAIAAGVGVGVVMIGVLAALGTDRWRGAVLSAPASPTSSATSPPHPIDQPLLGSIRVAQIDRAGTGLTLYVNPDRVACIAFPDVTPVVQEFPDRVVVTLAGEGTPTECETTNVTAHEVRLAQALGSRSLVDGAGAPIRPFFDADLPLPPPDWSLIPGGYTELDGTWFAIGYQVPGFQVHIHARTVAPDRTVVEEVTVGSHSAIIYSSPAGYGLQWRVRDLAYELMIPPNEGDAPTIEDAYRVIELFEWP